MNEKVEIFRKHELFEGRMISGSKSGYRERHPDNDAVFNARIFTKSGGLMWWGDLDITVDNVKLQNVCNELGEEIAVTYESVGWAMEKKEFDEVLKHAHARFTPKSKVYHSKLYEGFETLKDGNMIILTSKGVNWIEKEVK